MPERALTIARERCIVHLSPQVVAEMREVLGRPKFKRFITPYRRRRILKLLSDKAQIVEPQERVAVCRDPDDDKYLELAFAASADMIVSGDQDLLVLDPWRGIRILSPAAFVALWDDPPP